MSTRLCAAAIVPLGVLAIVLAAARAARRPAPDLDRGRALYASKCASCHGPDGRGDGSASRGMDPPPRDFTRGVYKLRSTPSGSLPTDDDLFGTITRGVPGTAMPAWSGLPRDDRWQLVDYLKSLSPHFARGRRVRPPIEIPPAPPSTPERVARGATLYQTFECGKCHGPDGRGDGPAARSLVDDRGRRTYPFDMTRPSKQKAGRAPEDLYRVLRTGLDGTPMPSFAASLDEEETWALVHFTRSLFVEEE